MSKCPFWSTTKERVECNNECPMQSIKVEDSDCVFKEYATTTKFNYKDIVEDAYEDAMEKFDESLLGIKIEKEASTY